MTIEDILTSPDKRAPRFLLEFQQGPDYYRYSNGEDFYLGATLYRAGNFSVAKMKRSVEEGPSAADIRMPSDDPVIRIFDAFLPVEPVICTIRSVELNDTSGIARVHRSGAVVGVNDDDQGMSTIRVMPYSLAVARNAPWQMQQSTCVLALYGIHCGVNPELFKTTSIGVTSLTNTVVTSAAWANPDPTWFKAGHVRCRETRETRFVLDQGADGALSISYPFAFAKPSHTFDAYAGCMRTGQICKDKFDNKRRLLAFEHIPVTNAFKTGLKN